jgi:hypothetical protein
LRYPFCLFAIQKKDVPLNAGILVAEKVGLPPVAQYRPNYPRIFENGFLAIPIFAP